MVKKSLFRGKKAYATVSPVLEIATLKIIRQRLKFDNYLVNVCETTIKQILFIATI